MVIGMLGFGTVGKGLYEILLDRSDMRIKYIFGRHLFEGVEDITVLDIERIISDREIDTVVEVIGGVHPAYEYVKAALSAGKNVVTANKQLVIEYYRELIELAVKNNVYFRYSAAVGGGVPWLISLERAHRISRVYEVGGIMNGTTNFILDKMESEGVSFDMALAEAQERGYAEKDPSNDIDGVDTRRKTAISANVAFGVIMGDKKVDTLGIRYITEDDVKAAHSMGRSVKLYGIAKRNGKAVSVFTEPVFIPDDVPESKVHGCYNMITFDCRFAGKESFYGQGAGKEPTGYAVAHDCLDIQNMRAGLYNWEMYPAEPDNSLEKRTYYVRSENEIPALTLLCAKKAGKGMITKEVGVSEFHALVRDLIGKGEKIFAAGIEGE